MYPKAYIQYLSHFHGDRDYFECHEVLEEHWKQNPPHMRKRYWVGFIQLAVALYHQRRGNYNGAYKMIKSAISILKDERESIEGLGLSYEKLLQQLKALLYEIKLQNVYTSIDLPIIDPNLLTTCIDYCNSLGVEWKQRENPANEAIIHKHKMRDRSDIVNERLTQLRQKRTK